MSTPEQPDTSTAPPETPAWTEEDVNAAMQSAFWFDSHISEELIGPYRGMHVAIFGEQIIDADPDFKELCRRLDEERPDVPTAPIDPSVYSAAQRTDSCSMMEEVGVARVRLYLWDDPAGQQFLFRRGGSGNDSRSPTPCLCEPGATDPTGWSRRQRGPVIPGASSTRVPLCPSCRNTSGVTFVPNAVTPLPFDSAMPASDRSVSVGNGNYPYELGELPIRLWDQNHRTMDLRIVAKFTQDNGLLTLPMTLGLRGGAIDGARHSQRAGPGASFGQAWWLEDP